MQDRKRTQTINMPHVRTILKMIYIKWMRCIIAGILANITMTGSATAASHQHTISIDGYNRTYLLYRPASLSRQSPVPLVIMLHGGLGIGAQAEKAYGWDEEADTGGFIVAYPDGINRSWNAGGICCGKAMKNNVDDLKFITLLIDTISRDENIDPRRIYLTGMSNGAALSYRYACEGSYPIAAIGPVSGSLSFACSNPHSISVMEIHGMDDDNIPFTGGTGSKGITHVRWLPVEKTLDIFRQADNCSKPLTTKNGSVTTEQSVCANSNEVVLITIDSAGHQWPGGKRSRAFGRLLLRLDQPSNAINATAVLWKFFSNHTAH